MYCLMPFYTLCLFRERPWQDRGSQPPVSRICRQTFRRLPIWPTWTHQKKRHIVLRWKTPVKHICRQLCSAVVFEPYSAHARSTTMPGMIAYTSLHCIEIHKSHLFAAYSGDASNVSPASPFSKLEMHRLAIPSLASTVALPRCGTSI